MARRKRCKFFPASALTKGARIERREHGLSLATARKIARDHLCENPRYYSKGRKFGGFDAARKHDMGHETSLAPYVIADSVVAEVAQRYGEEYGTREDSDWLGDRAEELFTKSESFRKKMKRRDPRGLLAAFMRHWLASRLMKRNPRIAREVGDAAWYGTRL